MYPKRAVTVSVMPSKATCKNASGSLTGPISGRVARRSAGNAGITCSILIPYSVAAYAAHQDILGSGPARVKIASWNDAPPAQFFEQAEEHRLMRDKGPVWDRIGGLEAGRTLALTGLSMASQPRPGAPSVAAENLTLCGADRASCQRRPAGHARYGARPASGAPHPPSVRSSSVKVSGRRRGRVVDLGAQIRIVHADILPAGDARHAGRRAPGQGRRG